MKRRVETTAQGLSACRGWLAPISRLTRCAAQLRGGRATLSPLRLERDSGLWVEASHGGEGATGNNDGNDVVLAPLASLRRVDAFYAQRAVADRVSNPHGEHAENTWQARAMRNCAARFARE